MTVSQLSPCDLVIRMETGVEDLSIQHAYMYVICPEVSLSVRGLFRSKNKLTDFCLVCRSRTAQDHSDPHTAKPDPQHHIHWGNSDGEV